MKEGNFKEPRVCIVRFKEGKPFTVPECVGVYVSKVVSIIYPYNGKTRRYKFPRKDIILITAGDEVMYSDRWIK